MVNSRVVKAFEEGRHYDLPPVEVSVSTAATLLIKRNPNRTQLVIVNQTTGAGATRSNNPPGTTSAGTRIEGGGVHTFRVDRDGAAVQGDWYGILASGSGTFTVTEYIVDRSG